MDIQLGAVSKKILSYNLACSLLSSEKALLQVVLPREMHAAAARNMAFSIVAQP